MKQIFYIGIILFCQYYAVSQKKLLDTSLNDRWPAVFDGAELNKEGNISKPVIDTSVFYTFRSPASISISADGQYVAYAVPNENSKKDDTLYIRAVNTGWQRKFVRRDCLNYPLTFSSDSKWGLFMNKDDSLFILSLAEDKISYISSVSRFQVIKSLSQEWLVCSFKTGDLLLRDLNTGKEIKFSGVKGYEFSPQGTDILIKMAEKKDSNTLYMMQLVHMANGEAATIWKDSREVSEFIFSDSGDRVLFSVEEAKVNGGESISIWSWRKGEQKPTQEVDDQTAGIPTDMVLAGHISFSKDGDRIFFILNKKVPAVAANGLKVDVWNYQNQLPESYSKTTAFAAITVIGSNRVIPLQLREDEHIILCHGGKDDGAIIFSRSSLDAWWRRGSQNTVWYVSTVDGSRSVLMDHLDYIISDGCFCFSPGGRWLLYFDRMSKAWFSYDIRSRVARNITHGVPFPLSNENSLQFPGLSFLSPVGIAGWLKQDRAVLIYDDYDIWQIDPNGVEKPVNITRGYGRTHSVKLRIARTNDDRCKEVGDSLLLNGFNTRTKYNGFYRQTLPGRSPIQELYMGPYLFKTEASQLVNYAHFASEFVKASSANVWVVSRSSATTAYNYFITKDLREFAALTNVQPQKKYNWLTSELINWKLADGTPSQAIVYKPENFDSRKKYPVIFHYYEQLSDYLNYFYSPIDPGDGFSIPYYVSRGYVIVLPDLQYHFGHFGQSVVNSLTAVANYMMKYPWVDNNRMGITGHSNGGAETNYLVTHTHLFAAAAEGAGPSDCISSYLGMYAAASDQFSYEVGQARMGTTLWERPDLFIENNCVMAAHQATTPLLMMHNKGDGLVPFVQGLELFNALRRLGKRVWLLQYDGHGHSVDGAQGRDYVIRMEQFFDHYLKGEPPPKWMTEGIPSSQNIDNRYELDRSGKEPEEQKVLWGGKFQKVSEALKIETRPEIISQKKTSVK